MLISLFGGCGASGGGGGGGGGGVTRHTLSTHVLRSLGIFPMERPTVCFDKR